MQFGLLGPLEVIAEQGVIEISGRTQRRLLAVLLVHARTVVSADRLIDILWAGEPPVGSTARLVDVRGTTSPRAGQPCRESWRLTWCSPRLPGI